MHRHACTTHFTVLGRGEGARARSSLLVALIIIIIIITIIIIVSSVSSYTDTNSHIAHSMVLSDYSEGLYMRGFVRVALLHLHTGT